MSLEICSSVLKIKTKKGFLYALDLDDTIFKTPFKDGVYKHNDVQLIEKGVDKWLQNLNNEAMIIYITARNASCHKITLEQLRKFNLPEARVFYTNKKYEIIQKHYNDHCYVVFVDDNPQHIIEMRKFCPNVNCIFVWN